MNFLFAAFSGILKAQIPCGPAHCQSQSRNQFDHLPNVFTNSFPSKPYTVNPSETVHLYFAVPGWRQLEDTGISRPHSPTLLRRSLRRVGVQPAVCGLSGSSVHVETKGAPLNLGHPNEATSDPAYQMTTLAATPGNAEIPRSLGTAGAAWSQWLMPS